MCMLSDVQITQQAASFKASSDFCLFYGFTNVLLLSSISQQLTQPVGLDATFQIIRLT